MVLRKLYIFAQSFFVISFLAGIILDIIFPTKEDVAISHIPFFINWPMVLTATGIFIYLVALHLLACANMASFDEWAMFAGGWVVFMFVGIIYATDPVWWIRYMMAAAILYLSIAGNFSPNWPYKIYLWIRSLFFVS